MTENEIGTVVVDVAIAVHRELGPGLLESVYEVVLAQELKDRGITVQRQVPESQIRRRLSIGHRCRRQNYLGTQVSRADAA
jgi:GxxExxY protein